LVALTQEEAKLQQGAQVVSHEEVHRKGMRSAAARAKISKVTKAP
jgi:hypothetical protein